MNKDSVLCFKNFNEFVSFVYELDVYSGWKIQKGLLNDRGKMISDRRYVKLLRKHFDEGDFFRKKVSIAEIVSWLDTMTIVVRLSESLRTSLDEDDFSNIEIYVEYMIQMSKKMRIDYVLKYKNRLLLLEFRTVNTFEKIRPTWQMKMQELQIYKELMSYYMPDKKIILYSMICMFEYNRNTLIQKHRQYNNNQIEYLTEYIYRYLIQKK